MTKKEFDPNEIHEAVISSWPYTGGAVLFSYLYALMCPHLLGDEIGISIITGGIALMPLTMATLLFWILGEKWKKID